MATPLRFRVSTASWSADRVRRQLYDPLDANLGAERVGPWFACGGGYETARFEMDDGSMALFAWDDEAAYWLGNTETPRALWETDKRGFDAVPYPVARWAQRELLATLHERDPWFERFPHLSWFFLPVFCSKDGRATTRRFFREGAAGFPDCDPGDGAAFYERFLHGGALDDHRYVMAAKLGTSEGYDRTRMAATMGEFDAAKLLHWAGHSLTPEIEVTTGHSLDFRADPPGGGEPTLVEVVRPVPPARRTVDGPVRAVRETAAGKTGGQLARHGGGVVLFVDCTSFDDGAWAAVREARPEVGHRPAVVFRYRPDDHLEGYAHGSVPLALPVPGTPG